MAGASEWDLKEKAFAETLLLHAAHEQRLREELALWKRKCERLEQHGRRTSSLKKGDVHAMIEQHMQKHCQIQEEFQEKKAEVEVLEKELLTHLADVGQRAQELDKKEKLLLEAQNKQVEREQEYIKFESMKRKELDAQEYGLIKREDKLEELTNNYNKLKKLLNEAEMKLLKQEQEMLTSDVQRQKELERKEAGLIRRMQQYEEKVEELAMVEKDLESKRKHIALNEETLNRMNERLTEKSNKLLETSHQEIAGKYHKLHEKSEELHAREKALKLQEARVEELTDHVKTLQSEADFTKRENEKVEDELAAWRSRLQSKERMICEDEDELKKLAASHRARDKELDERESKLKAKAREVYMQKVTLENPNIELTTCEKLASVARSKRPPRIVVWNRQKEPKTRKTRPSIDDGINDLLKAYQKLKKKC